MYRGVSKVLTHFVSTTDRKSCENIQGKPVDLAYNVTSYVWRPELGSKVKGHWCILVLSDKLSLTGH